MFWVSKDFLKTSDLVPSLLLTDLTEMPYSLCMPQKSFGVSMNADLLARLDAARGDVPRSKWIERAIENYLPHAVFAGCEATSPGSVSFKNIDIRPVCPYCGTKLFPGEIHRCKSTHGHWPVDPLEVPSEESV